MNTIENARLRVAIKPAGAELDSIFNKQTGFEYLWNGDPKFWSKKSPVLFPVVGTLKNNQYFFEDKAYDLNRHGFAREKTFSVVDESPESVTFELKSDESTLKIFPFEFVFQVKYAIKESTLSVTYVVENRGAHEMYFSVGGHPAFKLPVTGELAYDDYYLLFNKKETAGRWPISKDGLIEKTPLALLDNTDHLQLSKSLFYTDAIVLKNLDSDSVTVKSDKHSAGFDFSFSGFPYLGIWAFKDADFVCVEPWCGIADSVDTNQDLTEKEGINKLAAGESFERTWSVTTW